MQMTEKSLRLCFSDNITHVVLRSGAGLEDDVRRLSLHFSTCVQRSPTVLEVELDDLLANLAALANWPDKAGVEWEPALSTLVTDSTSDAQRVAEQLESTSPDVVDAIDPSAVTSQLGPNWTGKLTPFQQRDIAKLLSLRHGANFSVPGAGTTRVGLAVFQALREQQTVKRLLIVGPKSSYESWIGENEECFAQPLRMTVLDGEPDTTAECIIVNYERLGRSVNELGQWLSDDLSMLLLDEAHRMKRGADGTYGAACIALGPLARRRLILTGTPAPNGARDLENLLGFVWPGYGRRTVIQAVAGGDLAHASKALRPLFTRTTKNELRLPPMEPKVRWVHMPPKHQEVYNALIGKFSTEASDYESDFRRLGRTIVYLLMAATSPALLSVGTTRHEPLEYRVPPIEAPKDSSLFDQMKDLPSSEMSPKYAEALHIVARNAEMGRKTLVWSTFIRSLNTLERMMGRFSPAIVHGGTEDREEQIRRFRKDDNCMVLLSNPATLGEGINLHHDCHDAVYIDRDFAAGRFLQSLDRIHRLGLPMETELNVTVLASQGTIDEIVAQRLADKLRFMGGILDDSSLRELGDLSEDDPISGGFNTEDLQALMGYLRGHTV